VRDNLQNVSFDRWLMRAKDIIQIFGTIVTGIWIAIHVIERIDTLVSGIEQQENSIIRIQNELRQMRSENK
jgi:hypothetical protein